MVSPIIFVSGIFFVFITYFIIYIRIYNKRKLQLIDWSILSLATFNGLGFTFVYWATNNGKNNPFWTQYITMYDNYTAIIYLLLCIILGLSYVFGWNIIKSIKRLPAKNEKTLKESFYLNAVMKTRLIAWVMLFLGIVSYALYTKAYGGFLGILNYTIAIRSGTISIYNPLSFLQKLGYFPLFSSYLFFGQIIEKTKAKTANKRCFFGYIISFAFSIYVLYSMAGRVSMLVYFSTFILGYILYNYNSFTKLVRKLVSLVIILPLGLFGIDSILSRSSRGIGVIELFAKELSFPFASFIVQFGHKNYRLFKDIVVTPLFLLPQRVWYLILNIEVASSYNTFLFYGAIKGEAGVTGSIPVDMLTFANMQASIIGVIIVGFLWGGSLYLLEDYCMKIYPIGVRKVLYANMVFNVAILSVLYGDPQHIVIKNFSMIIGLTMLSIIAKIKLPFKKNTKNWKIG